jgi:hypothetical protein
MRGVHERSDSYLAFVDPTDICDPTDIYDYTTTDLVLGVRRPHEFIKLRRHHEIAQLSVDLEVRGVREYDSLDCGGEDVDVGGGDDVC